MLAQTKSVANYDLTMNFEKRSSSSSFLLKQAHAKRNAIKFKPMNRSMEQGGMRKAQSRKQLFDKVIYGQKIDNVTNLGQTHARQNNLTSSLTSTKKSMMNSKGTTTDAQTSPMVQKGKDDVHVEDVDQTE